MSRTTFSLFATVAFWNELSQSMQDQQKIIDEYVAAWDTVDVQRLLRTLHSQASWYDAFWAETCSGDDLPQYVQDIFDENRYWYRHAEDLIHFLNGAIIPYIAFDIDDTAGKTPVFNGVEFITLSDGLIMTVTDHYCDPHREDLLEVASFAERQHAHAHIVPLGLSAKTSARIKRRLSELKETMTVFLDPSLSVAKLADHADCSVMHLFHVLEEELGTSFLHYVVDCRSRYASTLLADKANSEMSLDEIAQLSGFETTLEFRNAFRMTFGMSTSEYVQKFAQ